MRPPALPCALASALALAGCGYTLVGKTGNLDPTIKKVGVPVFKDLANKVGLDTRITESVTEELLKRGHFDVVPTTTGVDAVVMGEILSYTVAPIGLSNDQVGGKTFTQVSRYSIALTARVKYTKTGQTEPIWQSDSFTFKDEYDLGDQSAGYFDREDQAIDRLTRDFAKSLVSAIFEAF